MGICPDLFFLLRLKTKKEPASEALVQTPFGKDNE